jgi:DNA-binding PadR family transcriptional regulator
MSARDLPAVADADLTKFQLRILAILAGEEQYGLAIKEELEDYYGQDVNHGRLYPNIDELVEKGYVEKFEIDKRTNGHRLTDAGREVVCDDVDWLADQLGLQVVDGDERLAGAAPCEVGGDD